MPGNLLNVPLRKMSQTADCLAACAAMVLDYIGHPVNYTDLLRLLKVGPLGTPAGRSDQPIIALVRMRELPYWQGFDTYHSVVVVGYDEAQIYVNDPHFDDAPQSVAIDDFRLAGDEQSLCCLLSVANQPTPAFSPWPSPWARPIPSSSLAKKPTG